MYLGKSSFLRLLSSIHVLVGILTVVPACANESPSFPARARAPLWSPDDQELFFEDAREVLQGPRPDYGRLNADVRSQSAARAASESKSIREPQIPWSILIDAETIESEIKRVSQLVARDTTNVGSFKGGGVEKCREHFAILAVWFAIAGVYDVSVRWQDVAPAARNAMAQTAVKCNSATDESFLEATQRQQQLAELIRGARPEFPAAPRTPNWQQTADRPPLMRRLELAQQERLEKWLTSPREFRKRRANVAEEAQLISALAEVIRQEGFEYWDDQDYSEYGRQLREAARDLAGAAGQNDFPRAQTALRRATNACRDCHAEYRG